MLILAIILRDWWERLMSKTLDRIDRRILDELQGDARVSNQELVKRVEMALQADPYFYEAHVSVSADNGSVVLSGMVFSDWDLADALRIARKAAGGARVIDNLTIVTGGRR